MTRVENVWQWDGNNLYLTWDAAGMRPGDTSDLYWVDKQRLTTRWELADWLAQLAEKTWATDVILGGFVRAVETHIGLRKLK